MPPPRSRRSDRRNGDEVERRRTAPVEDLTSELQLHFKQPYNLAILDSNAANASISFLEALDTPDAG
jgi:hypothetical protein